jgi:hypothetical protein
MRDLAVQFLALAEKQRATVPLMIGHRLMAVSLLCTGDMPGGTAIGRSHFTILPSIVRPEAPDRIFAPFSCSIPAHRAVDRLVENASAVPSSHAADVILAEALVAQMRLL